MNKTQEVQHLIRAISAFKVTDAESLARYQTLVGCLLDSLFKFYGERADDVSRSDGVGRSTVL